GNEEERLVTHYDLFFEDAELELRRIAQFIGLPDARVASAAALVTKRRRHTHFTIDHLIDARVAPEVIDLYRALIAEASAGRRKKAAAATAPQTAKSGEADLLSGAVSRLNASVPERMAQIEQLYSELLAQTEARHKKEADQTETRHKAQVEELMGHLAKTEVAHKAQVEELMRHVAKTEAQHKAQVMELTGHFNREIEQLRDRILKMNELLRKSSVRLAESETRGEQLGNRLRQQLKATQRLSRFLDEADEAAARLRSSARWQIANPVAALKAKLVPAQSRHLLGYGH